MFGVFLSRGQGDVAIINKPYAVPQRTESSDQNTAVAGPSNQNTDAATQIMRRNRPLARQQTLFQSSLVKQPAALERVPTEIIAAPPPPPSPKLTRQQLDLLENGIKVRDFAYESTLPPVPTVKKVPQKKALQKKVLDRQVGVRLRIPAPIYYITLEEELARRERAEQRASLFSRVNIKIANPARGIVQDNPSPSSNNNCALLPQARRLTPFSSTSTHTTDHEPQLGAVQETDSQEVLQHHSQEADSSQPPLDPESQASSDTIETPLVTPSASQTSIVAEANMLPESQQSSAQFSSQDVSMQNISESQMGVPNSQSQSADMDVDKEGTLKESNHSTGNALTLPSARLQSPASGKKLFGASSSLLYRRGSISRVLQSPSLKRKRSSFENEARYHLRSKDAASIPPARKLIRCRSSLPNLQELSASPPQKVKRSNNSSRLAACTRAKAKNPSAPDSSSRPLRRSARTRHSAGASVGT